MPNETYLGAKTSSHRLIAALEKRSGACRVGEAVEPSPAGTRFGEHGDSTILFDAEMLIAGASPDMLVALSAELDTLVAMCCFETVSATCMFFAADRGQLVRAFSTSSALRDPWSLGAVLPSEARASLASPEGLLEAFLGLGFDLKGWHDRAATCSIEYPEEGFLKWYDEEGPLGLRAASNDHHVAHEIPFEVWSKSVRVVTTTTTDPRASFVLKDGSGVGFAITTEPPKKRTWLDRLRGWLGD